MTKIERYPFPGTVRIPHGAKFIDIVNDSGQDFAYYAVDPDVIEAYNVTLTHRSVGDVLNYPRALNIEFLCVSNYRRNGQPQVLVAVYLPESESIPE